MTTALATSTKQPQKAFYSPRIVKLYIYLENNIIDLSWVQTT